MIKRILAAAILPYVMATAYSEETASQDEIESTSGIARMVFQQEKDNKEFAAELESATLSPEERAKRIEQWQIEQDALQKEIKKARRQQVRQQSPDPEPAPEEAALQEAPSDPVLANIYEIEKDIRSFQKSLGSGKLAAEQRAIQVERFHQINRDTLAELEVLKRNAATQAAHSAAADSPAAPAVPDPSDALPPRAKHLKDELDRVRNALSGVDPETRSQYLETHAAALDGMSKELSQLSRDSGASDVSDLQDSSTKQ